MIVTVDVSVTDGYNPAYAWRFNGLVPAEYVVVGFVEGAGVLRPLTPLEWGQWYLQRGARPHSR